MKNLTIAFLAAASLFTVGACKKKGGDAAEALDAMTKFKDQMCKCTDKACAEKVSADMEKFGEKFKGKKEEKPDEAMMKKLMDVGMALSECQQKAMGAGGADGSAAPAGDGSAAPAAGSADGSAAAGSAAPAAAGDLPAECNDYKAAIEAMGKCEKLPAPARDAAKKGFEQSSAAWASVPAEGKPALATQCKAAADAIKTTVSAACP